MFRLTKDTVLPPAGLRVLKAEDAASLHSAQGIIDAARERADSIVREAEAVYERQRQQGYEDGRTEGKLEHAEKMLETVMSSVEFIEGIESTLVNIVGQAIRKIVGELDDADRIVRIVRTALVNVRNQQHVTVRVAPADAAAVEKALAAMLQSSPGRAASWTSCPTRASIAGPASWKANWAWWTPASKPSSRPWRTLCRPASTPDPRRAGTIPRAPGPDVRRTGMAFEYIGALMEEAVQSTSSVEVRGRVEQVVGTIIRAVVPGVKVGELCILRNPWDSWTLKAEVVGFVKQVALLTPLGDLQGISPATEVIPTGEIHSVPVGEDLLGRVLDGLGNPIDGGPALKPRTRYPVYADPPNPMMRRIIDRPISLGLRVLDGMLTCGEGQRMGIFAAAGGGKSTLLSSIIKGCSADVCVRALIGERGRAVREFIEHDLGPEGRKKAVLVVSTSDRSSMERLKAAYTATAIAEYFRDQSRNVLLMMDSVTRFGRAQREIGLAAGEPPTRRGFPPSVFSPLPRLLERAGNSDKGSITALYTVLVKATT
jgi:type III secretion protein N (ATPase)